jgi:hypothetical protein
MGRRLGHSLGLSGYTRTVDENEYVLLVSDYDVIWLRGPHISGKMTCNILRLFVKSNVIIAFPASREQNENC